MASAIASRTPAGNGRLPVRSTIPAIPHIQASSHSFCCHSAERKLRTSVSRRGRFCVVTGTILHLVRVQFADLASDEPIQDARHKAVQAEEQMGFPAHDSLRAVLFERP